MTRQCVRHAATVGCRVFATWAGLAAGLVGLTLQHRQQNLIRSLDWERRIEPVREGLRGPSCRLGPHAIDLAAITANASQLPLQFLGEDLTILGLSIRSP